MSAKEFVESFFIEKNQLIEMYFDSQQNTEVGSMLTSLELTSKQMNVIHDIFDKAITDVMYTILLGLDGEASIGNIQQAYELYDENGMRLTGEGKIEEYAFEYLRQI